MRMAVQRSLMTLKAHDVQAFRRNCRGGDDFAAGEDWRRIATGTTGTAGCAIRRLRCWSLLRAGYEEEAEAWRRWLLRAIAGAPCAVADDLRHLRRAADERVASVEWLPGYENSKPVNIGNAASDCSFNWMCLARSATALARTPFPDDDIRVSSSSVQAQLTDHLCQVWDQPDDGIWENARRSEALYAFEGDGMGRRWIARSNTMSSMMAKAEMISRMEEESRADA